MLTNKGKNDCFGIGPAGTGKTYLAMAMRVTALKKNKDKARLFLQDLQLRREDLGFLPKFAEQGRSLLKTAL